MSPIMSVDELASHLYSNSIRRDLISMQTRGLAVLITDCAAEENALWKKTLTRADCRVFLCDSSKFRHMSTHRLCTANDVEYCFYDTPPKIEL